MSEPPEGPIDQPSLEDPSVRAKIALLFTHKRGPRRISAEAVQSIMECEADYVEQLTAEATRLARNQRVDDVAKSHVERADIHIRSKRQGPPLLEMAASATAGAAVAALYGLYTTPNADFHQQFPWLLALVVITAVLAYAAKGRG